MREINRIARGDYDLYRRWKQVVQERDRYPDFALAFGEAIFASHKKVLFVDIEHENPLASQIPGDAISAADLFEADYDDTLENIEREFQTHATFQRQREEHILQAIGPRLKALIDPNPKLKAKERVIVFMILGHEHTFFF